MPPRQVLLVDGAEMLATLPWGLVAVPLLKGFMACGVCLGDASERQIRHHGPAERG
jgi:hypothetical protein